MLLTPFSVRDTDDLVLANQDPEMARRFDFPTAPPRPEPARKAIRAWQRGWRRRRLVAFAVRDLESNALVGGCELRIARDGTANVSYFTVPARRGEGIATRAVRLLSSFALMQPAVERLEIKAEVDNLASQRVAERAGFVREGVLRSQSLTQRRRSDMALYSLLPSDLRSN